MTAEEGVNGNLVDVHWLKKNLNNPDLVILDVAGSEGEITQHIPGAISVNIYELFAYGFGGRTPAKAQQLFQSWGISPGKKIVIYDQGGTHLATRMFFDLDYHGFPTTSIFILDGGLTKWQKEGFPVTDNPTPAPGKGSFKVEKLKVYRQLSESEGLSGI